MYLKNLQLSNSIADKNLEEAGNKFRNQIEKAYEKAGNVLGMMPHPERAADPLLNLTDGSLLFQELINCC